MTITTLHPSTATSPSTLAHHTRTLASRRLSFVASVLWLGATATTVRWWWDTSDDWQFWYAIYSVLLTAAAGATAAASMAALRTRFRSHIARLGAALTVIAVFSTLFAWALPLWMPSIAIGYGVLAMATREYRRQLALLAVAQLSGVVVLVAGESLAIGPSDEWGSHPVAATAAFMTTSMLTVLAMISMMRRNPTGAHHTADAVDGCR